MSFMTYLTETSGKMKMTWLVFFSNLNNLGIILNLDWFAPYKYVSNYSVGLIYGVVANIKRHERYTQPNTFMLGVIPNLEKEPASVNSFLDLFVDDRLDGWEGTFFRGK